MFEKCSEDNCIQAVWYVAKWQENNLLGMMWNITEAVVMGMGREV